MKHIPFRPGNRTATIQLEEILQSDIAVSSACLESSALAGNRLETPVSIVMQVPVFKPLLPKAAALMPYLERMDEARWYSNYGPLVKEFESRIANHFGVPAEHVVSCSNGTIGLSVALSAMGARPGSYCAMPSWTFVATPAAAVAAGLKPLFVDVDRDSWALAPETVFAALPQHDIGAVIPVAPFGAPIDTAVWREFEQRTGIPVLIDAAAAFDSFGAENYRRPLQCSLMVSFHATKTLAMGEGAAIVANDAELAKDIRRLCNFGFYGSRVAERPGLNAKISEYTAAVGLASLDEWPHRRAQWLEMTASFLEQVAASNNIKAGPGMGDGWVSVYGNIELPAECDSLRVNEALARIGIETRSWWGAGCHSQPAYSSCMRSDVSNTDYLGRHVIGMPFWIGLDKAALKNTFRKLGDVVAASGGTA